MMNIKPYKRRWSGSAQAEILIVDDSALILELYRDVFEAAGFEVITRNTPFGTSSTIAAKKPDIVLLDVFMPALQGFV